MRNLRTAWLPLVIILAFIVAACAPTPAPTPVPPKPTPAAPAAPAATPTPPPAVKVEPTPTKPAPPIKIGILTPLVGPFASIGADMRDGVLLRFAEKDNRIAGRQVTFVVEDTEAKPDVGLTKARKLVEGDRVQVLVGPVSSAVAYAVAPYVLAQKVPLVMTTAGAAGLTQHDFNPFVFRAGLASNQNGQPFGEWLYKKGYRRAVIVSPDYAMGYEWSGGFARTFVEAGGKIIKEIYPALGTADFAPFLVVIPKDADVVWSAAAGTDALKFVQQYAEYGLKGKIPLVGSCSITDEALLPEQGDAAVGIIFTCNYSGGLQTPEFLSFKSKFESKYRRTVTLYADQGYTASMLLEQAIERVGGNIEDQPAFLDALRKTDLRDTPHGPVKLDEYQNPIHTVFFTEVVKEAGQLKFKVIETIPNVGQFWKWGKDKYLQMPKYADMRGKWEVK